MARSTVTLATLVLLFFFVVAVFSPLPLLLLLLLLVFALLLFASCCTCVYRVCAAAATSMSSSLSDAAMAPLMRALLFSFLLLLLSSCPVTAFYLPGVAPRDFAPVSKKSSHFCLVFLLLCSCCVVFSLCDGVLAFGWSAVVLWLDPTLVLSLPLPLG